VIPYEEEIKGVYSMKFVSRIASATFVAAMFFAAPAHALTIVLGHVNDSAHEATAVVIQTVLERMGYNVAIKKGAPGVILPLIAEGEIDIYVAASLPHKDGQGWEEYKDEILLLTPLYDESRQFWAVPDYIPASEVKSVSDLAKSNVAARMEKGIRGPASNSNLMGQSEKVLEAYALSQAGYQLSTGEDADWAAGVSTDFKSGKWFVVPLWQPHYLNSMVKLRILEEPKKLLGEPDTAWLVANKNTKRKIGPTGFGVLQKMELSVKWVNELDYAINVDKRSPRVAARRWMGMHPYTVEYWAESDED